jgi:hypothetical protein
VREGPSIPSIYDFAARPRFSHQIFSVYYAPVDLNILSAMHFPEKWALWNPKLPCLLHIKTPKALILN